jgi:catechol 2,3-dioxygenase-like lactoylglutathione lyase family enzyme
MDIHLHQAFLPHLDSDASLAFYRDALGLEVREDVGSGAMRCITVGPVDQPRISVVLGPPVASPDVTDEECGIIRELMSKGVYARICFSTTYLLRVFARLEANRAAEVIQEPIHHPCGEYDCVVLDPAGNVVRIVQERRSATQL